MTDLHTSCLHNPGFLEIGESSLELLESLFSIFVVLDISKADFLNALLETLIYEKKCIDCAISLCIFVCFGGQSMFNNIKGKKYLHGEQNLNKRAHDYESASLTQQTPTPNKKLRTLNFNSSEFLNQPGFVQVDKLSKENNSSDLLQDSYIYESNTLFLPGGSKKSCILQTGMKLLSLLSFLLIDRNSLEYNPLNSSSEFLCSDICSLISSHESNILFSQWLGEDCKVVRNRFEGAIRISNLCLLLSERAPDQTRAFIRFGKSWRLLYSIYKATKYNNTLTLNNQGNLPLVNSNLLGFENSQLAPNPIFYKNDASSKTKHILLQETTYSLNLTKPSFKTGLMDIPTTLFNNFQEDSNQFFLKVISNIEEKDVLACNQRLNAELNQDITGIYFNIEVFVLSLLNLPQKKALSYIMESIQNDTSLVRTLILSMIGLIYSKITGSEQIFEKFSFFLEVSKWSFRLAQYNIKYSSKIMLNIPDTFNSLGVGSNNDSEYLNEQCILCSQLLVKSCDLNLAKKLSLLYQIPSFKFIFLVIDASIVSNDISLENLTEIFAWSKHEWKRIMDGYDFEEVHLKTYILLLQKYIFCHGISPYDYERLLTVIEHLLDCPIIEHSLMSFLKKSKALLETLQAYTRIQKPSIFELYSSYNHLQINDEILKLPLKDETLNVENTHSEALERTLSKFLKGSYSRLPFHSFLSSKSVKSFEAELDSLLKKYTFISKSKALTNDVQEKIPNLFVKPREDEQPDSVWKFEPWSVLYNELNPSNLSIIYSFSRPLEIQTDDVLINLVFKILENTDFNSDCKTSICKIASRCFKHIQSLIEKISDKELCVPISQHVADSLPLCDQKTTAYKYAIKLLRIWAISLNRLDSPNRPSLLEKAETLYSTLSKSLSDTQSLLYIESQMLPQKYYDGIVKSSSIDELEEFIVSLYETEFVYNIEIVQATPDFLSNPGIGFEKKGAISGKKLNDFVDSITEYYGLEISNIRMNLIQIYLTTELSIGETDMLVGTKNRSTENLLPSLMFHKSLNSKDSPEYTLCNKIITILKCFLSKSPKKIIKILLRFAYQSESTMAAPTLNRYSIDASTYNQILVTNGMRLRALFILISLFSKDEVSKFQSVKEIKKYMATLSYLMDFESLDISQTSVEFISCNKLSLAKSIWLNQNKTTKTAMLVINLLLDFCADDFIQNKIEIANLFTQCYFFLIDFSKARYDLNGKHLGNPIRAINVEIVGESLNEIILDISANIQYNEYCFNVLNQLQYASNLKNLEFYKALVSKTVHSFVENVLNLSIAFASLRESDSCQKEAVSQDFNLVTMLVKRFLALRNSILLQYVDISEVVEIILDLSLKLLNYETDQCSSSQKFIDVHNLPKIRWVSLSNPFFLIFLAFYMLDIFQRNVKLEIKLQSFVLQLFSVFFSLYPSPKITNPFYLLSELSISEKIRLHSPVYVYSPYIIIQAVLSWMFLGIEKAIIVNSFGSFDLNEIGNRSVLSFIPEFTVTPESADTLNMSQILSSDFKVSSQCIFNIINSLKMHEFTLLLFKPLDPQPNKYLHDDDENIGQDDKFVPCFSSEPIHPEFDPFVLSKVFYGEFNENISNLPHIERLVSVYKSRLLTKK
ncbi:hypothetical protein BB560_001191 [Smittium megazygosporum]|uniref:RZZ complex subunit KNTC1/ROD C-terminal domain-containing protein n=1 Tax=Smittium megazygosporum TaxID=133381 RepID=A0A2T9ZI84_9FUNG|nr:hypothetical protein BB560_001191 [Smittium megazygosporum]